MTEETQNTIPEGTVKVLHVDLEVFRLNTKIKSKDGTPIGKTGKGVKCWFTDGDGNEWKQHLPEGKFKGSALGVPANEKLWKALNNDDLEEDSEATVYMLKGPQYWNMTDIKPGHIGNPGTVRPGGTTTGAASGGGGNGGGYNSNHAASGQLMNLAVAILQSGPKKKFGMEEIVAVALELVEDYVEGKEALMEALGAVDSPKKDSGADEGKAETKVVPDEDEDDSPFEPEDDVDSDDEDAQLDEVFGKDSEDSDSEDEEEDDDEEAELQRLQASIKAKKAKAKAKKAKAAKAKDSDSEEEGDEFD